MQTTGERGSSYARRRGRWALCCALALLAPAVVTAAEATRTRIDGVERRLLEPVAGYAVPIGGALRYDNGAVWSRLVQLAGGPGSRFVVLATAAGQPQRAAAQAVAALERHGAVAEALPVAPRLAGTSAVVEAANPRWLERMRGVRGVYFTGGAQERIVDTLLPDGRPTPLLEAIRDVQRGGGVIAGTSAGAAVMSSVMFRDAEDSQAVLAGQLRSGQEVDRGLGLVGTGLFVDQHFLRRGRIGRMLALMVDQGYELGLGVDEDTAAIVHGDEVEVLGTSAVVFVDLRDARAADATQPLRITDARVSLLASGDRVNLRTRVVTPAPARLAGQSLDPRAPGFEPYYADVPFSLDMLGASTFAVAMTRLMDSGRTEARGLAFDPAAVRPRGRERLGFEFRLHKGPDTVGWFTSAAGAEDYTIVALRLDVTPVRMADPLYGAWTP